jgi:tight adherence protein B
VALVLAAVGVGLGSAGEGRADPSPALAVTSVRPAVDRVQFTVSARDLPAGASLAKGTVRVEADGAPLRATASPIGDATRQAASAARTVVVVFDASGSMAGAPMKAARAAAGEFARTLPADIRLGLVTVSDRPATLLVPTADRAAFLAAVGRIQPAGDTALHDAARRAAGLLTTGAERRILVLSDGADTSSTTSLGEAVAAARAARAPVDVVGFGAASTGSGPTGAALRQLASGTGGQLRTAADGVALAAAFRSAATSFSVPLAVSAEVPRKLAGRTATLDVTVDVAGRRLTGSAPVTFATVSAVSKGPSHYFAPAVPGWLFDGVAGVVFLALLALALVVLRPLFTDPDRRRRIAQIARFTARGPAAPVAAPNGGMITRTALDWSQRAVQARGRESSTARLLERAGMSLRPNEWLLIRVCSCVTAIAALWLLFTWWIGIPLGLVLGLLGTRWYRRFRTHRRTRRFAEQLPDALQLVVGSLRSGFSLGQAVDALVREAADPVAAEFGRALAETRLGAELEDALDRAADRTASQDLAWIVMAIRIQREVGGNLAEVLQTAVETMRERVRLRRHVHALSAEGRLSAWILLALPIAIGVYMYLVRREYLSLLYTETLGILMLIGAVLLLLIGGFWMNRLAKVEV